MLIGQERLKNKFSELAEKKSVPQFIMLSGSKGQGKRTLAFHLSYQMGIKDFYVPEALKVDNVRDMIEDSMTLNRGRMYLISEADSMTVQAQNALLKFIEEPPNNAYIIMTVEHFDNVLSTIKSRAHCYTLDSYTQDELRTETDNELLLSVCENIGQIKRLREYDLEKFLGTAQKVADNISQITSANAFNIVKYFDAEDADLFIQLLLHVYTNKLAERGRMKEKVWLARQVKVIYKYKNQMKNKSLNKHNSLEMLFVELREVSVQ